MMDNLANELLLKTLGALRHDIADVRDKLDVVHTEARAAHIDVAGLSGRVALIEARLAGLEKHEHPRKWPASAFGLTVGGVAAVAKAAILDT